ncbi:hypothetical protein [Flagellimonas algicola]|uniref:Uncharacterized protein n=1 Tax=Flagellimonas algicola TaxID=2583815 RepID=A0ABY2WHM5_9FLAO|nr:hypothetical protein [Allomuricauda algicola]TMU50860.1 hypothetical protein FGG15_16665 [Allomuricauda algicola]
MNAELLKTYKQLEGMPQTEEVVQIKNQIKESLYQQLRFHFLELSRIGQVIGYDELQSEQSKAIELLEIEKQRGK